MATDNPDAAHARIMRDALETIAAWPINGNSEPDGLAIAIEAIQALAQAALNCNSANAQAQWTRLQQAGECTPQAFTTWHMRKD